MHEAFVVDEDEVDPVAFMIALERLHVRWLLIGRHALIHYGVPAQTMDYDLWIDPAPANVRRVLQAADEAGFEGPTSVEDVEDRPLFSFHGGSLKIDVFKARRFKNLDGESIDFASVYRRRVVIRSKGDPFAPPLPSLEHLRALKRMRDGAKDREDLRHIDLLLRDARKGRS